MCKCSRKHANTQMPRTVSIERQVSIGEGVLQQRDSLFFEKNKKFIWKRHWICLLLYRCKKCRMVNNYMTVQQGMQSAQMGCLSITVSIDSCALLNPTHPSSSPSFFPHPLSLFQSMLIFLLDSAAPPPPSHPPSSSLPAPSSPRAPPPLPQEWPRWTDVSISDDFCVFGLAGPSCFFFFFFLKGARAVRY